MGFDSDDKDQMDQLDLREAKKRYESIRRGFERIREKYSSTSESSYRCDMDIVDIYSLGHLQESLFEIQYSKAVRDELYHFRNYEETLNCDIFVLWKDVNNFKMKFVNTQSSFDLEEISKEVKAGIVEGLHEVYININ